MSVSLPRARLRVGPRELSGSEAGLARLDLSLFGNGAHDTGRLVLWSESAYRDAQVGDPVEIDLGESGSEERVFAGALHRVASGPDGLLLDAVAPTAELSQTYVSTTYLEQTVADIVKDLASPISIDRVEGDAKLPAYSVDSRRSRWSHILALAGLLDADVGCSPQGGLRFLAPKSGAAEVRLRYGADLLGWEGGQRTSVPAPQAFPYGAASESGAEKWHWLLGGDSEAKGEAATSLNPAFRNRDAADRASEAWRQAAERAGFGATIYIEGRPALRPGGLIGVEGLPQARGRAGAFPAALRIRRLHHRLDGQLGFFSELFAEGTSG